MLVLAVVAAAAGSVSAGAAPSRLAICNKLIEEPEATIVLGKLTIGYLDNSGSRPRIRHWPKVEYENGILSCLWQGEEGQLFAQTYDWDERPDRKRFSQQLCKMPGSSTQLCGRSIDVRDETAAPVASRLFGEALKAEAEDLGTPQRVPNLPRSFYFLIRQKLAKKGRLGTYGWGPIGSDAMIDVTCLDFKDMGNQRKQSECAIKALQQASD